MTTQFSAKPNPILYMPHNGIADVWLRKNIRKELDEDGNEMWIADEKYLKTDLSKEEVEERFDELFITPEDSNVSLEERIDTLENVILELMEVINNG